MARSNKSPARRCRVERGITDQVVANATIGQAAAGVKAPNRAEAAHAYAANGFHVFPAPPGTKKSYKSAEYSNGVRWGATKDPKQIERDFIKQWPDANIGIPTGNGLLVVDADTIEGHGVDGIAALGALQAQHGVFPQTRVAKSPSGSLHYWFKHPPGIVIKGSQSKLAPGVDVCGDGNMVLVPPSVRPEHMGGGAYEWLNTNEIADAPQWLIELCIKVNEAERVSNDEDEIEVNPDKAIAALNAATNDDVDEDSWFAIMASAFVAGDGDDRIYEAFVRWSSLSDKHDPKRTRQRWRAFSRTPPRNIGPGTLYRHANETAPRWREAYLQNAFALMADEYAAAIARANAKSKSSDNGGHNA